MKRFFFLSVISLATNFTIAQKVTFYKNPNGKLYTKQQIDSIISARLSKIGTDGITMTEEIIGQEQKGDTTFLFFKFDIAVRESTIIDSPVERENAEKWKSLTGNYLPAFTLKDINGNTIDSKKFTGKPVVLNFWYTTCLPCVAEMPALNKIKEDYKETDVIFLSMTYEDKKLVNRFLKKRKFDFPVITDARSYLEQFTGSYPVSVFVDRNGIIKKITYGMPIIANDVKTDLKDQPVDPTEFLDNLKEIL